MLAIIRGVVVLYTLRVNSRLSRIGLGDKLFRQYLKIAESSREKLTLSIYFLPFPSLTSIQKHSTNTNPFVRSFWRNTPLLADVKRREWQFVPDRLMGRQNANGVDKEVKRLAQLEVSPDRTPGLHAWPFHRSLSAF